MSVPRLQPLTRAKLSGQGEEGAAWHRALPSVLAELAEQWDLTLGRALPGGSASYVCRATTRDGEARVVKVGAPGHHLVAEVRVLRAAGGRGYVLLHAHDAERDAILVEALGRSLAQTPDPPERAIGLVADTLREAWTLPLDAVPPGEDKAVSLHALVRDLDERLGHPTDPAVLRTALDHAEALAGHDPGHDVVLHGDAHPGNTLPVLAPRGGAPVGHVFVDPDGFRGDPAYDAGVALRDWCSHLTGPGARARLEGWCDLAADHTGLDPARIWAWAFLERVSTGLYVMSFGAERVGRPFLASAEHLLHDRHRPWA
ncbi:aminoglycoside phosphotransferase family protein [Nocardioides currus]|uniref:Aminoglycoside phosphotransferase n=1 Tax=Nocardioides currus TaxID=2133958 RepID=A0A2R7YZ25_9ACTN|nr:aminoglycoside phosphotransferase family protein [Nocardioides currus]PUA81612.1 aminoglycoside phosphotransferase [Nocardioides currus]